MAKKPGPDPTAKEPRAALLEPRRLRLPVGDREVSALLLAPPPGVLPETAPRALLVLGHGAGAGMEHPFLEGLARLLASRGVATLRYQFPYMEAGSRRPDRRPLLVATVAAAVAAGRRLARELAADGGAALPLFAGGKSMGGRMTSQAVAGGELAAAGLAGLVFVGFPLHPAGREGTERGDHLDDVPLPMLFLQGSRDKLADLDLLRPVVGRLGGRATFHVVDGGDHSFHVLKRSGRNDDEVLDELADAVAAWCAARG